MSILLFAKNRGTNAFQIIMGIFLGISGASKRVLSVCNHMGISVSYEYVVTCANVIIYSRRAVQWNLPWSSSQKVPKHRRGTLSSMESSYGVSFMTISISPSEKPHNGFTTLQSKSTQLLLQSSHSPLVSPPLLLRTHVVCHRRATRTETDKR